MWNLVNNISHYCNISVEKCAGIQRRTVNYYDLTLVLEGEMTFIEDGKIYRVEKNDAILLFPGREHWRLKGTTPVKYASFNFTVNPNAEVSFPTHMKGMVSSEIKKLLGAFPHSHISSHYRSREKAASILNYILHDLSQGVTPNSNNKHVERIIRYIDENILEKMSLATISKKINLSREYTSSIFKKETGKSLTDYINERKIHFAKELIEGGEISLSQACAYVGYNDYTYFCRLFKKYFDITPIEIKRNKTFES